MKKEIIVILSLFFVLSFTSCTTTVRPTKKVVYVKKAPRHHKIVYANGQKYYKWNGHHHRKTKRGYIVVRIH
jgi:hypothetical protein